MRLFVVFTLCLAVPVVATGCLGDQLFGVRVEKDPVTGEEVVTKNPGPSAIDAGAGLISPWVPFAPAAASLLGNLYLLIRGRRYATVARSVIGGVSDALDIHAKDGSIRVDDLIAALKRRQDQMVTREQVEKMLASGR